MVIFYIVWDLVLWSIALFSPHFRKKKRSVAQQDILIPLELNWRHRCLFYGSSV